MPQELTVKCNLIPNALSQCMLKVLHLNMTAFLQKDYEVVSFGREVERTCTLVKSFPHREERLLGKL